MASALVGNGYKVKIVEHLDTVLPRAFDSSITSILQEIMEQRGIRLFLKEKVNSIIGDLNVEGVVTDKRTITCDTVIMATGMKPVTQLAYASGLNIGEFGGIVVDEKMQASADDTYACGDCIEFHDFISRIKALNLLWLNAKRQGVIAAYNCLGNNRQYDGSMNITTVDVFGTPATSIGITLASLDKGKRKNHEVIERRRGKDYMQLIVDNGFLVGVQTLGGLQNIGLLLQSIVRKHALINDKKSRYGVLQYNWGRLRILKSYNF